MKDPVKVAMGKKSRAAGQAFEKKVRADLEKKGWTVDRWSNNVEFKDYGPGEHESGGVGTLGSLIQAKPKFVFNPKIKRWILLSNSSGFPDYIAFSYPFIPPTGFECKTNGKLEPLEIKKCKWLLENRKFSKIMIAKKGEKRGQIIYEEFHGTG